MLRFFCIGLLIVTAAAHAQVYQRVDPLTGQITYTNRPPPGVEVETEAGAQLRPSRLQERNDKTRAVLQSEPRLTAQTSFPRVAPEEQRRRDLDRRTILTEELRSEVQALERLGQRPGDDPTARRHRANIASLEREIANLR